MCRLWITPIVAVVLTAGLLAGCASGPGTPTGTAGDSGWVVRATFPDAPAVSTRLIPIACESIRLTVVEVTSEETLTSVLLTRDAPEATVDGLIAGLDCMIVAEALPQTDGSGTPQASAQINATVPVGLEPLEITMASTIATAEIAPAAIDLEPGLTEQAVALAKDADGNIVLTGDTWTWSSSDEAVATVSSSGLVTAIGHGMCEVTALEVESGISAAATVSVTRGWADAIWPARGGSAQNTYYSAMPGPASPSLTTSLAPDGGGYYCGAPLVGHDGTLYVGSDSGWLHALDSATHEPLWSVDLGTGFVDQLALAEDGIILATAVQSGNTDQGTILAVDTATRQVLWHFVPDREHPSAGMVTDWAGSVYYCCADLYALDVHTGSVRWMRAEMGKPSLGPDGSLYSYKLDVYVDPVRGKTLAQLDPATGDPIWESDLGGWFCTSMAIDDDWTIFIPNRGRDSIQAVSGITGEVRWEQSPPSSPRTDVVVGGFGRVYCGMANGRVVAMDASTGQVEWQSSGTLTTVVDDMLVTANGHLYCCSALGTISVLDEATGDFVLLQLVFRRPGVEWSCDDQGRVYQGSRYGSPLRVFADE